MMRGKTEFPSTWPDYFRVAQFYAATDYVNANRARTLLCQKWWDLFEKYDVILSPAENTSVTNVVGTPSIVVPTGFAIPQPPQGRGGGGGGGGGGGRGTRRRGRSR
jgi:Asp-tRNA(Asn)/Glu-tRNA(Gln) amidotransferase A subunit family amidase